MYKLDKTAFKMHNVSAEQIERNIKLIKIVQKYQVLDLFAILIFLHATLILVYL